MPNNSKQQQYIKRRRRRVGGELVRDDCDPKNNKEFKAIVRARTDIKYINKLMAEITGYSDKSIDAWLATQNKNFFPNPAFRAMPTIPLRLLKLELGMSEPRYRFGDFTGPHQLKTVSRRKKRKR